ncbi:MAG: hypothetical protein QOC59_685, partial [Microbacteriaceae bacterium]|nr:hypothetical protein [Microbacteriaceae bacterium]
LLLVIALIVVNVVARSRAARR